MPPIKVSAMATSTGDWLSRALTVGGASTAMDILLPPRRTDQSPNHKSNSRFRFMAGSDDGPRLKTEAPPRASKAPGGDTYDAQHAEAKAALDRCASRAGWRRIDEHGGQRRNADADRYPFTAG